MIDILMEKATEVRKEWSSICDSVIHDKPKFIKRTRDKMWFSNLDTMAEILEAYLFTAKRFIEEDGSVTLSLYEIDVIENCSDDSSVLYALGHAILEYSMEYYNDYAFYSRSPNRKGHVPYIFKALIMDDPQQIGESILFQDGNN